MSAGLVWFRKDLRLADNPAWSAATLRHDTVTALFVIDPALWDRVSGRRVAQLAGNLSALDHSLERRGGRLRVERGDPVEVVGRVADETGASDVAINADVTRYSKLRDAAVADSVSLDRHWGNLVHPPGTILTGSGERYRVFTPFSRSWFETERATPPDPGGADITDETGGGIPRVGPCPLEPGEEAALRRLSEFVPDSHRLTCDRPDLDATSRISIDLKYGVLSPGTVYDHVGTESNGDRAFVRQLAWRDFYAHLHDENRTSSIGR